MSEELSIPDLSQLDQAFQLFLGRSLPALNDEQREQPGLAELEDSLHDLGSYLTAVTQQYLVHQFSKYKIICDRSLDKRIEDLRPELPDYQEVLDQMQDYKNHIDHFIRQLGEYPGLTLETWD